MQQVIAEILTAIPSEWKGTTFKNHNLLGREQFCDNLTALLSKRESSKEPISTNDLIDLGNAEDYLRVATNIATTLEYFLAKEKGMSVDRVYTFASTAMPIVAVALTANKPVHLYTGDKNFDNGTQLTKVLNLLQANFTIHSGNAPKDNSNDNVVLAFENAFDNESSVDGIISSYILYIQNTEKIISSEILVIRKRMSTPATTPMATSMLQKLAGVEEQNIPAPDASDVNEFYGHLQQLSGTDVNKDVKPVVCTAGLPTIASLWMTLLAEGGADILMASTAYGGSSQLTDILTSRSNILNKHTFDIQGEAQIVGSIKLSLDKLAADAKNLQPVTVLFVEVPTNPDMKVPDIKEIVPILNSYKEKTGKNVLLLVDSTFAPGSQVMKKVQEVEPDLPVIVFISLSKSVSRGLTTSGTLVPNHTDFAKALVRDANETANVFDTASKNDQLQTLVDNHKQVEDRCLRAYNVAANVGKCLCDAVKDKSSKEMRLAFPTPEQANIGFSSSTFSFNLPPPANASDETCEKLAQQFVDLLCAHDEFKPCVSFGQDNGLVYATVPATSTQGAIKEEDKAKQAVGGVQLVRLSFAPSVNVEDVCKIVSDAVNSIYSN